MSIKPRATHDELIRRYRNREPRVFIQYTGDEAQNDGLADKDGDLITAGVTDEMLSPGTIQVFIEPDITKAQALRLMAKIHRFICESWDERDAMLLEYIAESAMHERRDAGNKSSNQGDKPF